MQSRSSGPLSALVLAFLMVFTGLVVVPPPPAAAQAVCLAQDQPCSTGCIQTAAYPDFAYNNISPATAVVQAHPATRAGEYNQRTVRVANNCGQDINELRFIYTIRDQGSGCGAVTDPCSDDTSVTWERDRSFAPGWTVTERPLVGQTRTVADAVGAGGNLAGATALTSVSNAFLGSDVGRLVIGTNIPPNTFVVSVAGGGNVANINQATTGPVNGVQLVVSGARELIFKAITTQPLAQARATCGNRVVFDGTWTAVGTTTIESATANFVPQTASPPNPGDIGKPIVGPGIPAGATIAAVSAADPTRATISAGTTAMPTAGGNFLDIGNPAPCSATVLRDTLGNFDNVGVAAGNVLNILTGSSVGRYTVTSVTNTLVTFYPPAPVSLRTPDQYTIVSEKALNGTLLASSLTTQATTQLAQDFTLGFRVRGGSTTGTVIPIQVHGYFAAYPTSPAQATPFETTCAARASTGWRCMLPLDPSNCPCPPGLASARGQNPGVAIAMDDGSTLPAVDQNVPPTIRDVDNNGHIDRIEVAFTKRIDPRTFDPHRFSFQVRRDAYDPYDQYTILEGLLTDITIPNQNPFTIATFFVKEQPFYDTGGSTPDYYPYVNYQAPQATCTAQAPPECGLRDLAGNTMRSLTGTSIRATNDLAPPVMVGAWGRVGTDKIDVFFSESVANVNTNTLFILDGGGSRLPTNAPCNALTSISQFSLGPAPTNVPEVKNFPEPGWHYVFNTLPDPNNTARNVELGACDVHPLTGDALMAVTTGTPPVSGITDRQGNPLFVAGGVFVSGSANCSAGPPPTCSTTQLTDTAANFPAAGVVPGMRVRVLSGPAAGEYNITNVPAAQPTRISFAPAAPAPGIQSGDSYLVFQYQNRTWPSGAVEVRTSRFLRHVTYPLVERADMDIQDNLLSASITPGPGEACPGDPEASCVLRVKFNGPVRYPRAPTNKTDGAVTIADMDVASTTGTGQGPQGLQSVLFSAPDTDTILLRTDRPARATDVDNTPAFFKVHCERIQGTNLAGSGALGVSSFVPCDDPDRFYGWDEDPSGNVPRQDAAIVDVTVPVVKRSRTVDSNHDGYIDGLELTFSEPVNDGSFCQHQDFEPDFCPDSAHSNGMVTFHNPWSPNFSQFETMGKPYWQVSPKGGFRWDTGLVNNDNVGIMQLVNVTHQPGTNAVIARTRNFETDYATGGTVAYVMGGVASAWENGLSAFHRQRLASDYRPHFTLPAAGLFSDMAQQPVPLMTTNFVPPYCQPVGQSMYPGLLSTLNWNGPDRCNIQLKEHWTTAVQDGAPPVVWRAATVDTPFYDANHCSAREACHQQRASDPLYKIQYGNGTIDGYKLTFSEPVNDGSFCRGDWSLEDFDPYSRIHEVVGVRTIEPLDLRTDRANDPEITIQFNETVEVSSRSNRTVNGRTVLTATFPLGPDGNRILVPDTGTRPDLTYAPSKCGLRDMSPWGNVLPAINSVDVTEQDGAAPVMLSAGGFIGKAFLLAKFSEPVDDGNRGALVRDDFNYYDTDQQGVAGKSSLEEVCHGDADYIVPISGCERQPLDTAMVPLSAPLSSSDISQDRFAAVVGKIREIAPSVPVFMRQGVSDQKIPLSIAADSTPPGPLRDLRIEDAKTDSGSVTLSWTAPGNNGFGGGPVVSYKVVTSNRTAITDISAAVNPTGVVLTFTPPLTSAADANHTQTVQVAGLQPDTTYYFAVQAIDGRNAGPAAYGCPGTPCSTHTTRDATPPECVNAAGQAVACPLSITSSDCASGGPMQKMTGTFRWSGAKDDQSPNSLRYRYKWSHEELDRVLATDNATTSNSATITFPSNGTWYVHVSAFSGGGYTPTAHFRCVVGAGVIPAEDIVAANDALQANVEAVRMVDEQNGTIINVVRWTLPPAEELPGTIAGIEIWRKDGNTFILVHSESGTYGSLRQGEWTDNTVGAGPESAYRVQMVFAGNPEQTQPDPQDGYKALVDQTAPGLAPWVWILIGVGVALLVAGIVIFAVLRGKHKEAAGGVAYAWEAANPDQIGIDEATGLPVHEARCPSCNNPFQAIGNLPLPVTCPNCGTTGTLD